MKHLALSLILATAAWAQDPIGDLRERYAKFDAVRYRLSVNDGIETRELKVTWVRDQGYRAETPVELLVVKGETLWRCANHGLPKHTHMVEEHEHDRGDVPDNDLLLYQDPLLPLLEGRKLLGDPEGWTQKGAQLSAKNSSGEAFVYELDGAGLLREVSHNVVGRARVTVAEFTPLKAAPQGLLSLGKPTPSKPWHELAQAYVAPRLSYVIVAQTTSDSAFQPRNTVTGIYSAEQGFHVHLSAPGDLNAHSSSLAVTNGQFTWTSHRCADELAAKPHACGLFKREYDEEDLGGQVFLDDFVLAANLGARGMQDYGWAGPWSKDGKRWLKHGEPEGCLTEAVFDKRGRLKRLRSVDQLNSTETSWELAQWKTPRKLKDSLFEPNLEVHRPK